MSVFLFFVFSAVMTAVCVVVVLAGYKVNLSLCQLHGAHQKTKAGAEKAAGRLETGRHLPLDLPDIQAIRKLLACTRCKDSVVLCSVTSHGDPTSGH